MLQELAPDTAQRAFREIMEAFSRPGTIRRLPAGIVPAPVPAVLAPLLTLADIMTPVAALSSSAQPVQGALAIAARLTVAPVATPATTRFALAFDESPELAELNTGSHWSPETGAMLFQRVTSLAAADAGAAGSLLLTGPGIPPFAPVSIVAGGLSAEFFATLAELNSDYPSGVDVLLVTDDGAIAALARTTVVEASALAALAAPAADQKAEVA